MESSSSPSFPPNKRRRYPDQSGGGTGGGRQHRRHNNSNNQRRNFHRGPSSGRGRGEGSGVVDERAIPERGEPGPNSLSVAVLGCCHGEIGAVYDRLEHHQQTTGRPIDLLVCCGDFQGLRTWEDFHSLAVPPKYRNSLGSFLPYYIGAKQAPFLTLVIGGNHEASQPLQELYYGGWLAPRIYYLGAAGVVRYRGMRIGGLTGIFKHYSFPKPHWERPPYDRSSSLKSIYHVRQVEVARLKLLSPPRLDGQGDHEKIERPRLDIFLSHDWPRGIERHGNLQSLLRRKPFFRDDIQNNLLGNPAGYDIMRHLQPRWWFAAHLHVQFEATVVHLRGPEESEDRKRPPTSSSSLKKESSTIMSVNDTTEQLTPSQVIKASAMKDQPRNEEAASSSNSTMQEKEHVTTNFMATESKDPCAPPDLTEQMTKFLALDKCLPRKPYLSIVNISVASGETEAGESKLEYDAEWLAILQKTHDWTANNNAVEPVTISATGMDAVRQQFGGSLVIPENFSPTVPLLDASASNERIPHHLPPPLGQMGNPQTDELLRKLGLDHCRSGLTVPYVGELATTDGAPNVADDPNAIDLEENILNEDEHKVDDDNEIQLDDE